MKIEKIDVTMLELELTGTCNLKCPLCVRTNPDFKSFVEPNQRKLEDIIKQLDEYPNVKNMCLAGIMTEPTHYKELIPLLHYLESRNIETEMYINGNTKTADWWFNLGKELTCTKVIFTVCGSTQELHSKYRVGSNLENVYANAEAFMRSGNKNAWIQLIVFNYNEADIETNYDMIIRNFDKDNVILINSLPYQERFNIDSDIKMTKKLSELYNRLAKTADNRFAKAKLTCKSLQTEFISIDQTGKEYPCFLYKLYGPKESFNFDYTDILDKKHSFCYECENMTTCMLEMNNIERMA